MTDYHQTIAIINLTLSNYMRRRIIELGGNIPPTSEIYSTLSRVFTEHFHNLVTDKVEGSLKLFAVRINDTLVLHSDYELIEFIECAEKYIKEQLKTMNVWCPSIPHNHKYSSSW
jgi:hypothetical protein